MQHKEAEHVDPLLLRSSVQSPRRNTRASSSLQIWSLTLSKFIYVTSLEREQGIFRWKLLCSHENCCAPTEIPWQESTCGDKQNNCGVTVLVATSCQRHGMLLPPLEEQLIKCHTQYVTFWQTKGSKTETIFKMPEVNVPAPEVSSSLEGKCVLQEERMAFHC